MKKLTKPVTEIAVALLEMVTPMTRRVRHKWILVRSALCGQRGMCILEKRWSDVTCKRCRACQRRRRGG